MFFPLRSLKKIHVIGVRAHPNSRTDDPISRSLIWLHLQRRLFQIKSHSQVPGGRIFWGTSSLSHCWILTRPMKAVAQLPFSTQSPHFFTKAMSRSGEIFVTQASSSPYLPQIHRNPTLEKAEVGVM
uniref:Uncharacterized protein n=1 Tax=Pipistrellus kuhlii TaxID=59472 RepID=A0A7J7YWV7_PIPKU|nr:hypothetical protein mPipKuh1_009919 [Pipistrellus kuhlii]